MEQITTDSHCPMLCGHRTPFSSLLFWIGIATAWGSDLMFPRAVLPHCPSSFLAWQLHRICASWLTFSTSHPIPLLFPIHNIPISYLSTFFFFFFLSRMLCSLASSLVCSRRKELPASLQPSGNLHHSQNILPLPLMFSH